MFDKKGFMAFVGSNSGASYANGLENIEKVYGVDIDAEIAQDNCANLLALIDADKKRLSDNNRKNHTQADKGSLRRERKEISEGR